MPTSSNNNNSPAYPTEVNPYELSSKITSLEEKLLMAIDVINDNQKKIGEDVLKIREAVYDPDAGLYARLRVVEEERKRATKFSWLVLSVFIGSFGAYIMNLILNH